MKFRFVCSLIAVGLMFLLLVESKKLDPYKVLGVDKDASQRDIQKAFHKLSLKYHPDKNKNKGSQQKFEEINNAYEILSDEQKRKNYDLYGDERGSPGFDTGSSGDHGGYTFTSGPGQGGFNFRPDDWQNMGGHGGSKSFSFSFGGPGFGQQSSQGFGIDDIFSSFFGGGIGGGGGGGQSGGFGSSGRSQHKSRRSAPSITSVNSQLYRKEIVDGGITWLLLVYTSNLQGIQQYESLLEEVAVPLQGALKVGAINCDSEALLCKELGVHPRRNPKLFVYSYTSSEKGSLVEYNSDVDAKSLKSFCQDHLPRFSKRLTLDGLNAASEASKLPKVLLLSTKKNTPVIWRALSGLYRKRFIFYDAEVRDASDPSVRKLDVDSLPAIVGWLSNGEKQIIKSGVSVKDLKSGIEELSSSLNSFEKKNKKFAGSSKKDESESGHKNIPLLTASNFNDICSDKVPVCFVGVFRSITAKEKLQKIFQSVSQKSFLRQQSSRDTATYALLDASKQQSFLTSLDRSSFKTSDKVILVAYKAKRGTYAAASQGSEATETGVEMFVSSVLNGDAQFSKARQKPKLS
ncbi:dnaJ protein ERDJ3A [Andrographis paniculata]|uniref:dnaJ protein ERDJ3A n=1 Tax=Andrographis paniculata TaxID=175694 RepID=UPI0021E8C134|nr:dnaJ protein ERDJ3A [Andrographis paniculata]